VLGRGPDKPDYWGPAYDKVAKTWTMPFIMQAINTRVVRRSNALLNYAYGERSLRISLQTCHARGDPLPVRSSLFLLVQSLWCRA
jgi:short subunit dehydrogenase-like uncharacterized protein